MSPLLFALFIIALGFGGVNLAAYIFRKKRASQVLICPLHADCETVVHSEFSSFFGVPVELLGILYYGLIVVAYTLHLLAPALFGPLFIFLLFVTTLGAFLFSLYLTFIQAFTIRQWCTWCLISAGISTLIFILSFSSLAFEGKIIGLLAWNRELLMGGHLLGFAIGIGCATLADVFFMRFLKDFEISPKETEVLHTISQIIWLALAIIVVTGVGLYLPEAARLNASAKFLAKITVVAILIVNGAFLNLYLSPKLVSLYFGKKTYPGSDNIPGLRRLAFALGAVSFISWYTAFILGMLRSISLTYPMIMGMYLTVTAVAIVGSQVLERLIERRAR